MGFACVFVLVSVRVGVCVCACVCVRVPHVLKLVRTLYAHTLTQSRA